MIFISANEFEIIKSMGHDTVLLYMIIKSKMDGKSGIAGNLKGVNRLSETYLIEQLSYPDGRHHRPTLCSRNRLQRLLSQLKKQGLLKQEGLLCFSFPIATKSNNKSNNKSNKLKSKEDKAKSITYNQNDLLENNEIEQQIEQQNALYLNNNISNNILLYCSYEKICPHFVKFWAKYPKKIAKADAWRAWRKGKLDEYLPEILADIEKRLQFQDNWRLIDGKREEQYIKLAGGYLRGERWKDEWHSGSEITAVTAAAVPAKRALSISDDIIARKIRAKIEFGGGGEEN